jgi:hypothetical protein
MHPTVGLGAGGPGHHRGTSHPTHSHLPLPVSKNEKKETRNIDCVCTTILHDYLFCVSHEMAPFPALDFVQS